MESKTATFSEIRFPVQGMSCGSCVRNIKTALKSNPRVRTVEVNLTAGEVMISYNPQTIDPLAISEAIRKSGYAPAIPQTE